MTLDVSMAVVVIPNVEGGDATLNEMKFAPFGFSAIPVSPVTPFNVLVPVDAAANTISTPEQEVAVGTEMVLNPDAKTTSVVLGDALESEIMIGPIDFEPVNSPVMIPWIVTCPDAAIFTECSAHAGSC